MTFGLPPATDERSLNARYLTLAGLQEFAALFPLAVLVVHMTERGLGLGVVGLAFAVRSVIVVILEVPTGGLADAVGRRPVALVSQAFTLASMVALLLVTNTFTALVFAVLQGVGAALNSGSLEAWYVDTLKRLAPGADLQRNLARVEAVGAVALLGSGIGGVLPTLVAGWNLPWPLSAFGISLFVSILLRLVVFALTALLVEEPDYKERANIAGFKAVPGILKDAAHLARSLPVVPYLLVAMVVNGVAMISLETFWQPIVAATTGASAENSGIFGLLGVVTGVAFLGGSFVVMQGAGSRFVGGKAGLAGLSQLLKGLAIVLLAVGLSGPALGTGLGVAYFAIASNNIPHATLFNEAVPSDRRSVMLSLNSLALFLGLALGSGLLGGLAALTGPRLALLAGGLFTGLASLVYVGVARAQRRQPGALTPDPVVEATSSQV